MKKQPIYFAFAANAEQFKLIRQLIEQSGVVSWSNLERELQNRGVFNDTRQCLIFHTENDLTYNLEMRYLGDTTFFGKLNSIDSDTNFDELFGNIYIKGSDNFTFWSKMYNFASIAIDLNFSVDPAENHKFQAMLLVNTKTVDREDALH